MKFTLKSKTHVFGAVIAVFGAALTALPQVREFMSEESYGFIFLALSVGTVFLRNLTDTAIDQK